MSAQAGAAPRHYRVIVLGAGMSGICMGVHLRRMGTGDFVILEKAEDVGGTWRENTYPGVACDVPSHLYSFSFEPNPDWSHAFSGGGEILDYCRRCVDRYGLREHLRLGTEVTAVTFDGKHWQLQTADGGRLSADVVVSGLGGLHLPKHADIPGIDAFAGTRFHTAEWRHDHDLTGRRVAMIGTGASAAQVLPAIAERVADITVFQRSAAWVFPRMATDIAPERRRLFRNHPWTMRLYRWFLFVLMDLVGILSLRRGSRLHARLERNAREFLAESVQDPEVRAKLTPDYAAGCKRRVISDDYLATFDRDDVHLVTCGIDRVEATGIRDADGVLHEVDTIIEATGFRPFDISDYVAITGRDGHRLQDAWAQRVESFRTLMVPGFPNLFLLLGPNSATGHTSALIMIEAAARYVTRCLRLMDERHATLMDPTEAATRRFNAHLQEDMKRMVFADGCGAWYTDDDDVNFTLWPWSAARYVAEFSRVRPEDFRLEYR